MTEPSAVGHAFNIANARPVSQIELVESLAKACRKRVKFVRIPREYIARSGGHPMGPKMYFGVYLDLPPITQITAKAQRMLKFKPTDFEDGLKETYQRYARHPKFPKPDFRSRTGCSRMPPRLRRGSEAENARRSTGHPRFPQVSPWAAEVGRTRRPQAAYACK
jgi:hypothetical protein